MPGADIAEATAGFLLVFFVPGFAVTKALFPEWRVRGPGALRRGVEIVTLSFVLSVILTVFVGYVWLAAAPGGFHAAWSDPTLEATLAAIAVVALGVGFLRGAYRSTPPGPSPAPLEPEIDPLELTRELDRLAREERRVRHELRVGAQDPAERGRLTARLESLRAESEELVRRQEKTYED